MLPRRVLVTGANGLVGRELVERLGASPEYDVLATGQDIEPRFETASVGYTALDVTD
ncbi:MAG TPA: NAD-dependent epimerase/dehydratase family protein, partial [Rhodothermales bacterium]|nr:NAD-dependent epimerase/dehydratase family protein [Rhodothermales bacterium]